MTSFLKDPIIFKYGKFVISPEGILNKLIFCLCKNFKLGISNAEHKYVIPFFLQYFLNFKCSSLDNSNFFAFLYTDYFDLETSSSAEKI